jgi:quercetin dioxygenase-like cupin family protein
LQRKLANFLVIGGVAAAGAAALADMVNVHRAFPPNAIIWSKASAALPAGAETATLYGDPEKPGLFALRVKMPAGYKIPPHMHKSPELLTVISGQLRLGLGQAADHASVETLPAGSFSSLPQGVVHYVLVDQDSVVQLDGNGPWGLDYPNPKDDPRADRGFGAQPLD